MSGLKLTIVSPERELYSGDVDIVLAPGVDGQLGILPKHIPLITQLTEGELIVRAGAEERYFAIHGGFMHVLPDSVTVLADVGERADDIDIERAESAKKRAEQRLLEKPVEMDVARCEASLRRAMARLTVAEKMRRRRRL